MQDVQERSVGFTDVEDHQAKRLAAAAVVPSHLHVRGLYKRLTGLHRDRRPAFELERECPFQNVDGYR